MLLKVRELSTGMKLTFHRAFDVFLDINMIRCSDGTSNIKDALEMVISLGCDRLLTSGGSSTGSLLQLNNSVSCDYGGNGGSSSSISGSAILYRNGLQYIVLAVFESYYQYRVDHSPILKALGGVDTLSQLVAQSAGRICIVAASGVNAANVEQIIRSSGVQGVHTGSSVTDIIDSRCRLGRPAPSPHCHRNCSYTWNHSLSTVLLSV